ncbi:hypothetical protein C0J52_21567 [Blattella germanica]|nr:hypothetical protein C0J52_21567 [Blattella germanica]
MHSTTVIPLFVIAFVIIVSIVHQSVVAVDMMGSTEMSSSTMMTTKPSVMSSTSTTTIMSTSSTAMPTETPMNDKARPHRAEVVELSPEVQHCQNARASDVAQQSALSMHAYSRLLLVNVHTLPQPIERS